jgi:hypothetical protein
VAGRPADGAWQSKAYDGRASGQLKQKMGRHPSRDSGCHRPDIASEQRIDHIHVPRKYGAAEISHIPIIEREYEALRRRVTKPRESPTTAFRSQASLQLSERPVTMR